MSLIPAGQPADNDGFRYKAEVQVRFRDLDPMNHVNNSVYLTYFEIARIAYFQLLTGSSNLRDLDMILAEATCTYRSPATLDERLDVWIKATWLKRSSFAFEYRKNDHLDSQRYVAGIGVPLTPGKTWLGIASKLISLPKREIVRDGSAGK